MRLGENAAKDAVAAKDGSQMLKNVVRVSAKKEKLRKKRRPRTRRSTSTRTWSSSTRSSPTTGPAQACTGARRARPPNFLRASRREVHGRREPPEAEAGCRARRCR